MARTYDTQALLNSTYLAREHHADFRTSVKVECWLLYLVDLIREGKDIPKPPVDWISDYWDAQIPPATEAAPSLGDGQPKSAGTWDWYGCLDPVHAPGSDCDTFSIGVFQWEARSSGKGTKKGKSVKRFSGWTKSPEVAYGKARAFIAAQAGAAGEGGEAQ